MSLAARIEADEQFGVEMQRYGRRGYHVLRIPLDGGEMASLAVPKRISASDYRRVRCSLKLWRAVLLGEAEAVPVGA